MKMPCAKIKHSHSKLQTKIDVLLDPRLPISHKPTTTNGKDTWAMGSMMINVHNGLNKCQP